MDHLRGIVSYGLTNAYKEKDGFSGDARFFTFYVTAGVVLGGDTRSASSGSAN